MTPGGSQVLAVEPPEGSSLPDAARPIPSDEECAICLEPFLAGERVQPMVRCQHLFHAGCIDAFVEARCGEIVEPGEEIGCPICRGQLAARSLSEVPEHERDLVVPLRRGQRAGLSAAGLSHLATSGWGGEAVESLGSAPGSTLGSSAATIYIAPQRPGHESIG